MFPKLLVFILVVCVVCGVLLDMRHRKRRLMYEMTELHEQMDRNRKDIWRAQVAVSRQTSPAELQHDIEPLAALAPAVANLPGSDAANLPGEGTSNER
tara:strand:+ start:169 stop:462 length:294 start_codon:yes stop_codon:yes gene_type:complete